MANIYVHSGAGGAATGADWANAILTLSAALTASAAGDSIFVADDHSEATASAVTLTAPGTIANPSKIFCVRRVGGTVPPVDADLRATGIVATTGASSISFVGVAYCYGVAFTAGSGASAASISFTSATSSVWTLDDCRLELSNTQNTSTISFGSTSGSATPQRHMLKNVVYKFGNVAQEITMNHCSFYQRGGSVDAAGSIPTVLILMGNKASTVTFEGFDFSALGSGKQIVSAAVQAETVLIKDCKLGASVTKGATPTNPGPRVTFSRVDSAATNYLHDVYDYFGTETVETTIVRTGGASDGTTTIAKKIVTTANAKPICPYRSFPIDFWNDGTAAITCTIQGIWGGGAVPTNADIWLEAEYLSDAAAPLGAFVSDGKASDLAAAASQSAGSGTWGGGTTAFALGVTLTPAMKGPVRLTVCAGAASSTFYYDPKVIVT